MASLVDVETTEVPLLIFEQKVQPKQSHGHVSSRMKQQVLVSGLASAFLKPAKLSCNLFEPGFPINGNLGRKESHS